MNIFLLISLISLFPVQQTRQWVRLDSEVVKVAIGTNKVVLGFEIDSGFHIQSNEPLSDNLIPTTLELMPDEGVTVEAIVFPEPNDFELQGSEEKMLVFDGKMLVTVRLKIDKPLPLKIPGKFCYQVCDDKKCYFPRCLDFTLTADP